MEESIFVHRSVPLYEIVGSLNIKSGSLYADGTLGGDGYAYKVCKRLSSGKLVGMDQGADAIEAAGKRPLPFQDKVTTVRSNYANIKEVLKGLEIGGVDGTYLDLGVSSHQLDAVPRGFIYHGDALLDMRMDQRNDVTVVRITNTCSEMELYRIIRDYGEDNFAKNIAEHVVRARGEYPTETTGELAGIIKGTIPARIRATEGCPAKRTFQVIRIECNHELEVLEQSIDTMIDLLNPGGHLSIITPRSLGDRIVKSQFRLDENPCIYPPDFLVCVYGRKSKGKVVSGKPILPSDEELEENSRSKSAKLRIFKRGQSQSGDKTPFRSLRYERQQTAGKTGPCRCRLLDLDRREDKIMTVRTQASSGRGNTRRNTRSVYGNNYVQGFATPKLKSQGASKQETRQGKSSGSQSVWSNHRIRRNQERAMYMDLPYIIMLTIASVLTLYLRISHLHVQSSITARMHHIEKMEAELEQLRAGNDTLETNINTSTDLNKIYEIATKELGMVHAEKDQVPLYNRIEGEYVRQYEDIPER